MLALPRVARLDCERLDGTRTGVPAEIFVLEMMEPEWRAPGAEQVWPEERPEMPQEGRRRTADEYEGEDSVGSGEGDDHAKRVKRMKRNRESAALSRTRKKEYIEALESKVQALEQAVIRLQSDNRALRHECATLRPGGPSASLERTVSSETERLESSPAKQRSPSRAVLMPVGQAEGADARAAHAGELEVK